MKADLLGTPMRIPEGMTAEQAAMMQMHAQQMAIQPVLPTPEKKWYDRVVDSILGEDPCECNAYLDCYPICTCRLVDS